jgi:hypothetical protein
MMDTGSRAPWNGLKDERMGGSRRREWNGERVGGALVKKATGVSCVAREYGPGI